MESPRTPYIELEADVIAGNIQRMQRSIDSCSVNLRPHIKTHKSLLLAGYQMEAGACGITASKLSEVQEFANGGLTNIFMAYPLVNQSCIREAVCLSKEINLICSVDCVEGAELISAEALSQNTLVQVRLEIETGLGRTGVPYDMAVNTAMKIAAFKGLRLEGIFTFRGLMTPEGVNPDAETAGLAEGQMMVSLAKQIREKGVELPSVSVGSTPTAVYAARVDGITEVRPGTYIFNDRMQLNGRFCRNNQIGAVIKTSIVSINRGSHMVIDAGSKTLSADQPLNQPPFYFEGHGLVLESPDLIISKLSEEHGVIPLTEENSDWKIGDILSIVPNHICTCINLQDRTYLKESDSTLRQVRVDARGKVT